MQEIQLIKETDFQSLFKMDAEKFFNAFNKSGSESISTLTQFCERFKEMDDTMHSYLTDCMQKQIPASFEGYNKYVQGAIESNKQLTTSAKAGQIAFKGLAMIGNMLIMWAVSGAIQLISKGIDNLVTTTEEYEEQLADLKSELSDVETDLDSLNSELETTQERIKELEGYGPLSFTQQEEYDNLVKQNNELQRTISLLELEQKLKTKETNKVFLDTMNNIANGSTGDYSEYFIATDPENGQGQLVHDNAWYQDWKIWSSGGFRISNATNDNLLDSYKYYNEQLLTLNELYKDNLDSEEYKKQREHIQNELDSLENYLVDRLSQYSTNASGIEYISNPTTEDDKKVNEWLDYIADFQDRMAIAMGSDNAKVNSFNRLVDNWYFDDTVQELQTLGKEGKVTAEILNDPQYDEFIQKLVDLGVIDSADNLDSIALAFNSVATSAENAAEIANLSISETVDQLNTQLKPAMDSISDAWNKIFAGDGFSLENIDILSISSAIKSELDALEKAELDVDYSAYENFIKILEDTESTEEEVREGFNHLAQSIVNAGVSGAEDFALLTDSLNYLGVINSEIVAFNALIQNTEALKISGLDLTEATEEQIISFVTATVSAENYAQALALLQIQQMLVNENGINSTEDVISLLTLAKSAGIAVGAIDKLYTLMGQYEAAVARGDHNTAGFIKGQMEGVKSEIERDMLDAVEVDFDVNKIVDEISTATSAAETDYAALLDKETSLLEKQLDANLITFRDYLDKRKSLLDDYYTLGKITAEEYYDGLSSLYESQLSTYDKVVGAVTNRIDKEINSLEKQKEVIEESYRFKMDAVQAQIDALNKENEARKEQIALEQAQYEAERARNQRSVKQFVNGQFVYTSDMNEVSSAEENLAEQAQQMEISRLEDRIASLEQEMENATASLDNQIDALEAYKEQWSEISSVYEEQQNALITAEILGADWETQILNGRLETLQNFTTQYIALQQAQANAAALSAKIGLDAKAGISTLASVGTTPAIEYLSPKSLKDIPVYHNGLKGGYVGAPEKTDDKLKLLLAATEDHLTPAVPALLQQGELVLTASQQDNLTAALMRHSVDYGSLALSSYASGSFDFSKLPGTTQSVVQNINLTLPNITNQTGYENLRKELHQMQIDARQRAYRH